MKSQSLGLLALSFFAGTASAGARSRNRADVKYKDFNYPPRAEFKDLKDNQVSLGYEVHEGKLVRIYSVDSLDCY